MVDFRQPSKKVRVGRSFIRLGWVIVLALGLRLGNARGQLHGQFEEDEYFRDRWNAHSAAQVAPGAGESGGLKNVIFGALGGFALDWMWTGRSLKGLKRKHEEELELVIQKFQADREMIEIKKRMQLEEYQLRLLEAEQTIQQLQQAAVDAGMDLSYTQSQLDYEEFKQPDLNNDDMITREEFNAYIRMYMQTYPHIKREDMPRFEDFDLNGDGIVSFKEWEIYLDHQRRAEDETAYNNDVMNALYEQTHKSQGFNDVYNNMQRGGGARGRY